ncbi:MAG: PP0621 family protein [Candidatus Binatia bacterium]
MLLLRLLLLFLICYIVFLALKSFFFGKKTKAGDANPLGEPMILDPQCQTYVPKSEAVARDGKFFCSEECARLYLAH